MNLMEIPLKNVPLIVIKMVFFNDQGEKDDRVMHETLCERLPSVSGNLNKALRIPFIG